MSSEIANEKRHYWWLPLLVLSCVSIGFLISGWIYRNQQMKEGNQTDDFMFRPHYTGGNIDAVLNFIHEYYVDTISASRLEDKALAALLHQLDPHSEYIPPSHFKMVNEPLEGNFEGIGVEFNIIQDTVRVMNVIPGGPSEKAGILNGDRIIKADTVNLTGKSVTNEKVFKTLRGKGGTKVKVFIIRSGQTKPLEFLIVRDKIPLHSLEASFIISPGIGYMRFRQFSATTSEEFRQAINNLVKKGMQKLILDLRGNGGGYLNAAVEMADEFLPKGMRVVYMEGKKYPKKEYFSTEYGSWEQAPVVVLVDENSASASEIVAGALQDNDRAYILGRRTFGKGLVQDQISLKNGGAIRLTIARYYTPSGRCIQKPYSNDDHLNYYMEEVNRFNDGELFHRDSIKFDTTQKYRTPSGRIVYGGGGITPDIFVPLDTARFHPVVNRWFRTGRIHQFCFTITDANRNLWKTKYPTTDAFINNFKEKDLLLNEWKKKIPNEEVKYMTNTHITESLFFLLKAYCGRVLYGDEAFYPFWISNDRDISKALEILNENAQSSFEKK